MKRLILACWFSLCTLSLLAQTPTNPTNSTNSAAATPSAAPVSAVSAALPQPPQIAAKSYLLIDLSSRQVLAEKDAHTLVEPASLTKLMTAYLVFDALRSKKIDLQQTFGVSERAWKMQGSRMFIDPKMRVPVEDLLKGMIVQSGNDATVALAEGVGGTVEHFVNMMNAQAAALGMKNTGYKNPEGLPAPGHTTTAHDLSILATRLIQDFPEYIGYYAIKQYRYPGTPPLNATNRNKLLHRDPSVDGLKTGYTEAAGYCLIATARRDFPNIGARRLLSIVLGAASEDARADESQKLLNWGYTAFEAVKLFEADQAISTPTVWKGSSDTVRLGSPKPLIVAIPAGTASKIKTEVSRTDPLIAPITQGQTVGTLHVQIGDQTLQSIPLVALEAVPKSGWFGSAWDAMRLWIK